ncbi:MAG: DUF1579 domain-containing protein [Rhodopirellula sp.]|nr:DUF1579 domain-containing protein [Rhodopirellula sp.]
MLSLVGAVLVASATLGQAETPATPLQELGDLLVGRWTGDVTLIADWPGIGKKGEKIVGHWSVRWIADKRGLEDEGFAGQGTGKAIYFWDAASKKVRQFTVDSGGTTGESEIWKQDGQWSFRGTGSLADGTKTEGQGTLVVKDCGNTLIVEGTGTVGGKATLPLHDVYRRASK